MDNLLEADLWLVTMSELRGMSLNRGTDSTTCLRRS
jgi:hypothetical protein